MKPLIVLKFGGTSVGSAQSFMSATDRVAKQTQLTPLVVVSALCGATDLLSDLKGQSSQNNALLNRLQCLHMNLAKGVLSPRTYRRFALDFHSDWQSLGKLVRCLPHPQKGASSPEILAFGELQASKLFYARLGDLGVDAHWFDARDFLVTGSNAGNVQPLPKPTSRLLEETVVTSLKAGKPTIIQGFIGRDHQGQTSVLGRGGSDYTATFLGAQLAVRSIQIWTDVSGLFDVDPRLVPQAQPLRVLHPKKARQLAAHGAKVLYAHCLEPLMDRHIPLEIRNTFKPDARGTLITRDAERDPESACITVQPGRLAVTLFPKQDSREERFNSQAWLRASALCDQWDWFSASPVDWRLIAQPSKSLNRFMEDMTTLAEVQTSPTISLVHLFGGRSHQRWELYNHSRTVLERARIPLEFIHWADRETHLLLGLRVGWVEKAVGLLHHCFYEPEKGRGRSARGNDFVNGFKKLTEVPIGR